MRAGAVFRTGTWAALALATNLCAAATAGAKTDENEVGDLAPKVWDAGAKSAIAADLKARRQSVVVTPFAVLDGAGPAGGAAESCRGVDPGASPAPKAAAPLDAKVLDAVTAQLAKRLSRKVTVSNAPTATEAASNTVVIVGCITRHEAGSGAKRMLGLHFGASRLAAHVRVLQKGRASLTPVVEFDLAVTGGALLPPLSPLGVALHVATLNRQTLMADAKKLGNRTAYAFEDTFFPGED